jgi:ribose transport system ATP-binding protein
MKQREDNILILTVNNISKSFPGVLALDMFSFQLNAGEIHGLVGENGAGKSTFIKILNGLFPIDEGEVYIFDRKIEKLNPIISNQLGLKFIHQELSVFPYLSIMENIFVNNYPKNLVGIINWKQVYTDTKKLLEEYGLDVDAKTKLFDLSIGQMQLIEIITAVTKKAKIIIMDEPTASLGDTEKDKLFSVMNSLKKSGISIIFITHILEEILSICDRATVLRDGKKIGTYLTTEINRDLLIEKIVGEKVHEEISFITHNHDNRVHTNRIALEIRNVTYKNILKGIDFSVRYGTIIGILGLLGAGKSEIAKIIFGLLIPESGDILINGIKIERNNPLKAIKHGIGFVTEDRHKSGLFYYMSVLKNCSIAILKLIRRAFQLLNLKKERQMVKEIINKLNVKASSINQEVRYLSGGNQQKVVLGRWLVGEKIILLLDEPTKGIDVGARSDFYRILNSLRTDGKAIVLFTSDHREAFSVCDRILLLKDGEIQKTFKPKDTSPKELLHELTKVS